MRPPPFSQWLLGRALGDTDEAPNIVGDLQEEWNARYAIDPRAAL